MSERLDHELRRLRNQLHADAARAAESSRALEELHAGPSTSMRSMHSSMHRARWFTLAATVGLVAASIVALVITRGDEPNASPTGGEPTPEAVVTANPSVASIATTPIMIATSVPPDGSAPSGPTSFMSQLVRVQAVQFVDPTHGWMLAELQGVLPSPILLHTTDGHHWFQGPAVANDPVGFVFVDRDTGWLWGDDRVWVTHDSGTTLTQMSGAPSVGEGGSPVLVVGDTVYVAGASKDRIVVTAGKIDGTSLSPTGISFPWGAGPQQVISLAHQGDTVFVAYNDRTLMGSARIVAGKVETAWVLPAADGGNVFVAAAPNGDSVYVYSETGVWGNGPPKDAAYASTDGGDHFHPITLPDLRPGTALEAVGPKTLIAYEGSDVFISTDSGSTFHGVPLPPFTSNDPHATVQISFSPAGVATAVVTGGTNPQVWISTAGGIRWQRVLN